MFEVPRTPDHMPKLFVQYWNERKADGIASLFTKDAEFINVVGL